MPTKLYDDGEIKVYWRKDDPIEIGICNGHYEEDRKCSVEDVEDLIERLRAAIRLVYQYRIE